jgi:predicted transcriptional regulator
MERLPDLIDQIEAVRRKNNELWMQILRIALTNVPVVTKAVLTEINKNDRKISTLLEELSR